MADPTNSDTGGEWSITLQMYGDRVNYAVTQADIAVYKEAQDVAFAIFEKDSAKFDVHFHKAEARCDDTISVQRLSSHLWNLGRYLVHPTLGGLETIYAHFVEKVQSVDAAAVNNTAAKDTTTARNPSLNAAAVSNGIGAVNNPWTIVHTDATPLQKTTAPVNESITPVSNVVTPLNGAGPSLGGDLTMSGETITPHATHASETVLNLPPSVVPDPVVNSKSVLDEAVEQTTKIPQLNSKTGSQARPPVQRTPERQKIASQRLIFDESDVSEAEDKPPGRSNLGLLKRKSTTVRPSYGEDTSDEFDLQISSDAESDVEEPSGSISKRPRTSLRSTLRGQGVVALAESPSLERPTEAARDVNGTSKTRTFDPQIPTDERRADREISLCIKWGEWTAGCGVARWSSLTQRFPVTISTEHLIRELRKTARSRLTAAMRPRFSRVRPFADRVDFDFYITSVDLFNETWIVLTGPEKDSDVPASLVDFTTRFESENLVVEVRGFILRRLNDPDAKCFKTMQKAEATLVRRTKSVSRAKGRRASALSVDDEKPLRFLVGELRKSIYNNDNAEADYVGKKNRIYLLYQPNSKCRKIFLRIAWEDSEGNALPEVKTANRTTAIPVEEVNLLGKFAVLNSLERFEKLRRLKEHAEELDGRATQE